jgi:uncharacterized protein (DUF342 family)
MDSKSIYKSEKIEIIKKSNELFIKSFKSGMTMEEFNLILKSRPEIKITNFLAVKNSILDAPKPIIKFGLLRERISVEISKDELKASVVFSLKPEELEKENREYIYNETIEKLTTKGVTYGIKELKNIREFKNGVQIIFAEGKEPVSGNDSIINLYKLHEVKPKINEDNRADFYELNLINKVKKGEWLGERIEATNGKSGVSVLGNSISPQKGKKIPLLYDRNTVDEVKYETKSVLYSKQVGAVHFEGDRIGVSNHLEIVEDVDFKTGNVNFDGYLTIKGSVADNFSIKATKDIEILGAYGVGAVKEIYSKKGSVYIKGGIAGKGKALIKAEKNVYSRYISEASIFAKGSLNIGSYCLNSDIEAQDVTVESMKGYIIGGNVRARIKITTPVIGSKSEIKTNLMIHGFERDNLKSDLEEALRNIEELKSKMTRLKAHLISFREELRDEDLKVYENVNKEYVEVCDEILKETERRNVIITCLRTLGEGEIKVLKKMFPKSFLKIRDIPYDVKEQIMAISNYVVSGEFKQK